jgi:hypothetical protein
MTEQAPPVAPQRLRHDPEWSQILDFEGEAAATRALERIQPPTSSSVRAALDYATSQARALALKGALIGLAVGVVVGGAAGVVVGASMGWSAPPAPAAAKPVEPTVIAPVASPRVDPPIADPPPPPPPLLPSNPVVARPQKPVAPVAPVARSTLADELVLFERAEALRRHGRCHLAMIDLEEHQRLFPSGQLDVEVELSRVTCLQALGRGEEAVANARRLLGDGRFESHRATLERVLASPPLLER